MSTNDDEFARVCSAEEAIATTDDDCSICSDNEGDAEYIESDVEQRMDDVTDKQDEKGPSPNEEIVNNDDLSRVLCEGTQYKIDEAQVKRLFDALSEAITKRNQQLSERESTDDNHSEFKSNQEEFSDDLPVNFVQRYATSIHNYAHHTDARLNGRLTIVTVIALAMVLGLGIGHFIGAALFPFDAERQLADQHICHAYQPQLYKYTQSSTSSLKPGSTHSWYKRSKEFNRRDEALKDANRDLHTCKSELMKTALNLKGEIVTWKKKYIDCQSTADTCTPVDKPESCQSTSADIVDEHQRAYMEAMHNAERVYLDAVNKFNAAKREAARSNAIHQWHRQMLERHIDQLKATVERQKNQIDRMTERINERQSINDNEMDTCSKNDNNDVQSLLASLFTNFTTTLRQHYLPLFESKSADWAGRAQSAVKHTIEQSRAQVNNVLELNEETLDGLLRLIDNRRQSLTTQVGTAVAHIWQETQTLVNHLQQELVDNNTDFDDEDWYFDLVPYDWLSRSKSIFLNDRDILDEVDQHFAIDEDIDFIDKSTPSSSNGICNLRSVTPSVDRLPPPPELKVLSRSDVQKLRKALMHSNLATLIGIHNLNSYLSTLKKLTGNEAVPFTDAQQQWLQCQLVWWSSCQCTKDVAEWQLDASFDRVDFLSKNDDMRELLNAWSEVCEDRSRPPSEEFGKCQPYQSLEGNITLDWLLRRAENRKNARHSAERADWYRARSQHRQQARHNAARSEWVFERAKARQNERARNERHYWMSDGGRSEERRMRNWQWHQMAGKIF